MSEPARENLERAISFAAPDITEDEIDAVVRVLRSGWITTGEECFELERELAEYLGAPHVVSMSSCTAALETAFGWLDLPAGSRVGVPTWTFVATALAPMKYGLQPVLLDIDDETLNASPEAVKAALADGLDALVIVHFGGVPVDASIHQMCADAGVPVVEDAAHALGAMDDRGRISGLGSVGACLSFYATKNLTSAEGGALVTHDPDLAEFARAYRFHGMSRDAWARYGPGQESGYELIAPGIKANLPDVLAALARSQLRRFDDMQEARARLADRYRMRLDNVAGVRCHPATKVPGTANHLMVVSLPENVDRSRVAHTLDGVGVSSSVHFQPLHAFRMLAQRCEVGPAGLPVADSLAAHVLSLPLHLGMDDSDIDRVCDVLLAELH